MAPTAKTEAYRASEKPKLEPKMATDWEGEAGEGGGGEEQIATKDKFRPWSLAERSAPVRKRSKMR